MNLAPWQQRIYQQAADALDQARLPHALLFAGPARLGKRQVAEKLARRVLCLERGMGEEACGQCRSCQLFDSRRQWTRSNDKGELSEMPETRPDGELVHPFGYSAHPDVQFIGQSWNEKVSPPKMRGEIVIEQIRQMSEKLALTSQYGVHQVALLDPADAINHAAANALLKTLEEPQSGRFIWLISAHPARLPATIRSRTQKLEFRLPAQAEALQWLIAQGHSQSDAENALAIARGHPGLADQWLGNGVLALRTEVAEALQNLRRDASAISTLAQQWVADENAAQRLSFAADIALQAASKADAERIKKLAHWFDEANQCRNLLRTTIRADLAVLALLQSWHALWRS
ncbi:DNA polymerase III subunit delta' [Lysobacteraceae bacterium NML71-0210]|nr:DNA polymerase III subunit delta' [Xanthomonadaceae bacterium NML71-0210]